ncbi:hypothetical protein [Brevibacillus laterosporus]|uniref:hypothetical protein n=1 Tax=Brevibacillus laterosporus TaxID=1465 RepID=UPI00264C34FF|nr:hypothetical protein [Brevibacillus laterosporus]MDN9012126.1 hypothetical protein [Brevibacillus laterosporus]MDO0943222.1 hypothetical protein [Brevibacillus laterosporus]
MYNSLSDSPDAIIHLHFSILLRSWGQGELSIWTTNFPYSPRMTYQPDNNKEGVIGDGASFP